MSELRNRLHPVRRSLFGGIAALAVGTMVLSGLAAPALALDSDGSDTPTIEQVVNPDVDAITVADDQTQRCANSRGNGNCNDGDDEPIVDQEVQEEVTSTTTTTTTAAPVADPEVVVAGGGEQLAPAPVDQVLSGEVERAAPAPAASLPRTGTGIGLQVTVAFGLMGAGITILRLARRRRPATQG